MNGTTSLVIGLLIGLVLGAILGKMNSALKNSQYQSTLSSAQLELESLKNQVVGEQARVQLLTDQLKNFQSEQESSTRLSEALKAVQENMNNLATHTRDAELARTKAEATLREQIENMKLGNENLHLETTKLTGALSNAQSRGKYGEAQLERLLEDSGLIEGVHFFKQDYTVKEDRVSKPDIKIAIPGGSELFIDSKFPFDRFLEGVGEKDAFRRSELMNQHAKDLLGHVNALAKRGYADGSKSADYVVLFAPFESILSEALEVDPSLLNKSFEKGVTIATPTTMMALLRTVAYVFSQSDMAHNAAEIKDLAGELLKRIGRVHQKLAKVGNSIKASETAYNDLIGSVESNMLVPARKMQALGVPSATKLDPLNALENAVRALEFRNSPDADEEVEVEFPEIGEN